MRTTDVLNVFGRDKIHEVKEGPMIDSLNHPGITARAPRRAKSNILISKLLSLLLPSLILSAAAAPVGATPTLESQLKQCNKLVKKAGNAHLVKSQQEKCDALTVALQKENDKIEEDFAGSGEPSPTRY
jgi:hypothetical protein